ncbi:MAG: SDR family oxidoreductase [Syntrophomonadaceae bacterium]
MMQNIMDKFSLAGKKAIVTGGAKGISYSIAEGLHEAGAQIVLIDLLDIVDKSAATLGKNGPAVYAVKGDLTVTEDLQRIYNESLEKLEGRVDIVVNGAGIQYRCIAEEFPIDKWKKIIDINLNAVFFICQLAARTMIKQGYGRIINIASMCSFFGATMIPAYTASKGGIMQLTKALSNEWASKGINVNAIAPGYIITELTANMKTVNPQQYEEATKRIPMGRWGEVDDLKGIAVFLASDASQYITGATIPVDGGYLGK